MATAAASPPTSHGRPPSTLDAQASAASVVVRPDLIVVPFAIRAVASEPDAALALIEQTIRTSLTPRFAELGAPSIMKVHMRGSQVDRVVRDGGGKKTASKKRDDGVDASSETAAPLFAVALQGTLEYPLAPTQDYWERARLIARIDGLRAKMVAATRAENSPYEASIEAPRVAVKDPEAARGELLARWVAKRKQFAREAKSADLAVAIDACRPPADIVVRALSLEEIELTLPIDCARQTQERTSLQERSAFVVAKK